jgi:hypothetical protein
VIGEPEHVFAAYMSPGSVTEIVHCYAAAVEGGPDDPQARGLAEEGEDIEMVELPFDRALEMVRTGAITDAKTIMLLQWAALDGPFARDRSTP